MMRTELVQGRKIRIEKEGNGIPYVYWGFHETEVDPVDKVMAYLREHVENLSITLVMYETKDWNGDFSPWPAEGIWGDPSDGFSGKGPDTLQWLLESCIPFVEGCEPKMIHKSRGDRYLAGYSLAGLFSLWGFYESQAFGGCVSGSGSLWYSGWQEYRSKKQAPADSHVYLSLGGKEEKTKNAVMASIGDRTREEKRLLDRDRNVTAAILEWNSGGHFAEPDIRMAKGMAWILNRHARS